MREHLFGGAISNPRSGDRCVICGSGEDVDYSTFFARTLCHLCHVEQQREILEQYKREER